MVGHTQTLDGDERAIFIMRVDPLGSPLWTKIYGQTPGRSFFPEAEIRSCGSGYIIAGSVLSPSEGGELGYLIRITDSGALTWMRFYQQVGTVIDFTRFNDVQQTGGGAGFVVTGSSFSQVPSGMFQNLTETLVMSLDSTGNVIWANQYPYVEGADSGESVLETLTGYAIAGTVESFGFPATQLFTVDSLGNIDWYRRLDEFIQGGYSIEDSPANGTLHTIGNGDLVLEGGAFTNEAAVVRFDSLGNFVAGQSYGFNAFHYASSSVVEPLGAGFTFTGISSDGVNRDYHLVRTDPILETGCDESPFAPIVSAPPVTPIALTYSTLSPTEEINVAPSVTPLVWDEYVQCQASDCLDAVPITCTLVGSLDVNVSWPPLPATLATAELWRNGVLLVTVTGTSYTDTSPPFGVNTYELRLYDVDPLCDPASSFYTANVDFSIPYLDATDVLISLADPLTEDPIICWNDSLVAAGRDPLVIESIDDITPDIGINTGVTPIVWISLGQAPFSRALTPSEGQAIAAFLGAGGSLYIEGGDVASSNQTVLAQMDGVAAISNGTLDGNVPGLVGLDSGLGADASGLSALYRGPGRFVDNLAPDGNGAAAIFESSGMGGETTGVYSDASISGNGTHKVITMSTLSSGYGGDIADLVSFVTSVLSPPVVAEFIRGDSNGDGTVGIGDPLLTLAYLFTGGASNCLRAEDVNDDGFVDVSDPIYSLGFQFAGGPAPSAPFPNCGIDPTPDTLSCDSPTCP